MGFWFLGLAIAQGPGGMGFVLIAGGCYGLFIILFGSSMLTIFGVRIIDWLWKRSYGDENHLLAKIGQYALIKNDDGCVLLLERINSKTWSLPGGRLNKDEMCDLALIREVKEETNLDVLDMKPFATNIVTDPYQTKYCVYFEVSVKNIEEVRLSREHSDFRWISLNTFSEIEIEDSQISKVVYDFLNK